MAKSHRSDKRSLIKVGVFAGATVVSGSLFVLGMVRNGKEAVHLYEALQAADQAGGDVSSALNELRQYIYAHMNTEIDDPNYTLDSVRKSKGGRFLTQGELKPITDIQTIVGQTEALSTLVNSVDTGPIVGIVKSSNPFDTKAQLMKAEVTAIVPKLARGVYGEVGVLTDQDIDNYSRTIANLKNTNDVNKAVMAMTLDIATRSLANQLNSLSAGGRDVSRFEAIYTGLNKKASEIKSQLGIGQTSAPQTSTFQSKKGNTYTIPNLPN